MNKTKGIGIILSYLLIVIDTAVGILFVPFLLRNLGASNYGLYKLMVSTASYLSILDFGIGGTMTRYIVKYKTQKDGKGEENFTAMGFIIYGILASIVILAAAVIIIIIPYIYKNSISAENVSSARLIFAFICTTTAINLFNHAYNGILHAYEKFIFNKLTNIFKIIIRVALIVLMFRFIKNALIIALVDFALSFSILLINVFYVRVIMKKKIKLHKFEKTLAKEAFIFTFAILMQSIINQFNSNLDNVALGVFSTTAIVAMYSLVLQIYNMYENLSTSISTVYLPSISESVFKGEDNRKITKRIIEPSRIQFMVLFLALVGFIAFGRSFIFVWVGDGYENVYILCLILLASSTLELSQSTITSVLKAKNKLHGKTIILLCSTAVNAAITFSLVPLIGPYGAVIGTATSLVLGYGVALNIYYQKCIGLDMKLYFKEVFGDMFGIIGLFVLFSIGIARYISFNSWWKFLTGSIVFSFIYILIMYFVGMNHNERELIHKLVLKVRRSKKA